MAFLGFFASEVLEELGLVDGNMAGDMGEIPGNLFLNYDFKICGNKVRSGSKILSQRPFIKMAITYIY